MKHETLNCTKIPVELQDTNNQNKEQARVGFELMNIQIKKFSSAEVEVFHHSVKL